MIVRTLVKRTEGGISNIDLIIGYPVQPKPNGPWEVTCTCDPFFKSRVIFGEDALQALLCSLDFCKSTFQQANALGPTV